MCVCVRQSVSAEALSPLQAAMRRLLQVENQYLRFNIGLMRYMGIWPETSAEMKRSVLQVLCLSSFIFFQIKALNVNDMAEFTEIGCTIFNIFNILCKMCHLLVNLERFRELVKETTECCVMYGRSFPDFKAVLERSERHLRLVTFTFISFNSLVAVLWGTLPIFLLVLRPEDNIQLPLKMWFPLDTTQGAGFIIAWAYEITLFVLFTPIYIILHTFYIGLIILTCGQLKLLSSLLSSAKADKPEESHKHLRFCVAMHCRILSFGKELERLLRPIMLIQFVLSMACVCQIALQATMESSTSVNTIKFMGYLMVVLAELWLYCYFGNDLIHHGEMVQLSTYSCDWVNMTTENKKLLIMIIMRSQRPLQLTIGQMVVVSLNTFTEVMKVCYSMFTLLRQLNETEI